MLRFPDVSDWVLKQWNDVKGNAKWALCCLILAVIAYPLTRQLSWLQQSGLLLIAIAFGVIGYAIGRAERKSVSQADAIDVRPTNRIEIYEIRFDYLPASPLANGWKVAYQDPEPSPHFSAPEILGVGGLTMDVKKTYAIQYSLPSHVPIPDEMELAIKYGDGAMFHLIVNVASRDHSHTDFGQIKIKTGNAAPEHYREYPKEHAVYVTPEPVQNGWLKMRLPIREIVSVAMGNAGWVYESLKSVQLRGCISVSPIKFFQSSTVPITVPGRRLA
jgi:hypothetical protein